MSLNIIGGSNSKRVVLLPDVAAYLWPVQVAKNAQHYWWQQRKIPRELVVLLPDAAIKSLVLHGGKK